ncbi:MAG: hypothetical protein RIS79_2509 [Verrucomicrobiota bacterium]
MKHPLHRRNLIAWAAGTLLGVHLPRVFAADAKPAGGAKAKNIIYLYMDGGMSHIDTCDPKQGETAGPTKAIKTSSDGIQMAEYLPRTAQQMHHGCLVRSITSTQGAHGPGNYFMHTSYEERGTILHPSLGAWLSNFRGPGNSELPASAYIGNASRHPGAGFFPPVHTPLFINDPEVALRDIELPQGLLPDAHEARMLFAGDLDSLFLKKYPQREVKAYAEAYDGAFKMMKSADIAAFDLTREKKELRERYGSDPFGQGCLLARRLIEHGIRFVEVSLHGWDTHSNNFVGTPDLCEKLDAGLATLVEDLHQRGLLKDTLVVVTSEFGRTPKINVNKGRDHYPKAFSSALFGGGVKGGTVFGSTDKTGAEIESDALRVPDFNATLAYALGLPLEQIVYSPTMRPFTVANKGKPATSLFA